jgi:hypothetical protein
MVIIEPPKRSNDDPGVEAHGEVGRERLVIRHVFGGPEALGDGKRCSFELLGLSVHETRLEPRDNGQVDDAESTGDDDEERQPKLERQIWMAQPAHPASRKR